MFRFLSIFILTAILSVPSAAQEEIGDVRNFIWGVGPDDVVQYEDGTYFDRFENAVLYLNYAWDMRSLITYEFTDKAKLWRTEIEVQKPYNDPDDLLDDFFRVQDAIERRYGAPAEEDYIWYEDEHRGYPNYLGWAIYEGDLEIKIHWVTERSDIVLSLGMDKFRPDFRVVYKSRALEQERLQSVERDFLRIE